MFYLNDKYYNNELAVNVSDRGFLLGDGVFTTIKAHNNRLLYFDKHIERLTNDAKKIYLNVKLDFDELKEICLKVLQYNNLENVTAIIRITLTRGCSGRGINILKEAQPTLLVKALVYQDNLPMFPRLCTTKIIRNEKSILSNIKSLNYLELILARQEAVRNGYDDGVMLNTKGALTECSVANIFFITQNNEVITPLITDGVLPGIIRGQVIMVCKEINIPIFEKSIYLSDVPNYRAAFITNCAIGIKTIQSFDNILLDCQDKLIKQIVGAYY